MVKETAKWVAATQKGVQVEEIPLGKSFPDSGDSSVLDPLRAALQRYAGQCIWRAQALGRRVDGTRRQRSKCGFAY